MKLDGIGYGFFAGIYGLIVLIFVIGVTWTMVLLIKFLRLRIAEIKASKPSTDDSP